MDGGYGKKEQHTLRSALRAELKATGRRKRVRIIEMSCMGVCPKKAATAGRVGGAPLIINRHRVATNIRLQERLSDR